MTTSTTSSSPIFGATFILQKIPGFVLEIAPGSATFPDGSRSGLVSVTPVHADKVPMVPNFGQQPQLIVTIQPAGVEFDPPARFTLPNVEGLPPGEITELYSFDHDAGRFVSIGPGVVSADGSVVTSDPGVGIIKGGWHCGGNPQSAGCCKKECSKSDNKCVRTSGNTCSGCKKEQVVCNDGNKCNGPEHCDSALGCISGPPLSCSDGLACQPTRTSKIIDEKVTRTFEYTDQCIIWTPLSSRNTNGGCIQTWGGPTKRITIEVVAEGTTKGTESRELCRSTRNVTIDFTSKQTPLGTEILPTISNFKNKGDKGFGGSCVAPFPPNHCFE